MRKSIYYIAFCFFLFPTLSYAQATYPFGTILKKVYADQGKNANNVNKPAQTDFESIRTDGSWADVNYEDKSTTAWLPVKHLEKVSDLVYAYSTAGSAFYQNEKVYQAIVNALKLWYAKDPKSSNWWHNEISVPQKLGLLLVIMTSAAQQLPDDLQSQLIERMKRGDMVSKTGANKTDIAMHYFYRALLTEDTKLLAESLTEFFKPVSLVEGEEGLQHDFSYLQHGPQLYIGGYGNVFLGGVIKIANYVAGTPYALSKEKLALLSTFYQNTYLKTFRNRYTDFNVEGRGVSRPNNLRKPSEKYRLNAMKTIDAANASLWENERLRVDSAAGAVITPYHQHFWKGDYTVHVRPEYNFNVRISSKRTKRAEAGNNENLYGKYLSDGATNLQLNGPEYYNIMPVWEWDKIPGVTAADHAEDVKMTVNWGETGTNEFAGGVSDGIYGATAYQLDYDGVKAKKAWFFFDKEIVALGADIKSKNEAPIATTLNQTWLLGAVNTSAGAVKKGELKNLDLPPASWVQHNGVFYYFPEQSKVTMSTQLQQGNWNKINQTHSKENVAGDVFKLWIAHGVQPDTASYQYIVLPAAKNIKSFDPKTIAIVSNSTQNQVVYHEQLKILQAVFYSASTVVANGYEIKAAKPCIIMWREGKGNEKKLYVADPLQTESAIQLQIKNIKTGKLVELAVAMPDGAYKGSSKEVAFSL
ncbi:polysaccharide lyase 8 family protein [Pedobacter sp. SL55]|uniref:polysaccharide lyase 8 family protein n=1 Tax=Pedobacter sp. SL55 TaxID=2995161 RepID=UPI00226FAEA5|nr:polysaccharide lyase 8 family protein [Pedobacter sp. SL55]WAC40718.1 polysaccharide lyase 8 family protein [Pedobacter sp. SL55]